MRVANTLPEPPEFCTGSPYISDVCINVTRILYPNGTTISTVNHNPACKGQEPPARPPERYFYCSYPKAKNLTSPGLCCEEGKYAAWDSGQHVWYCEGSEICGIQAIESCHYDYDLNNPNWRNSVYAPSGTYWCQSKFPNYFTPDIVPYPRRSTGCCLIAKNGAVDYFTDENNVKIFGYQHICGDGVVDLGEQCDGSVSATCADYVTCSGIYVPTGTVTCTSGCQINHATCHCALAQGSGSGGS